MSARKSQQHSARVFRCRAWAPASVGNTAVGFDTLGFALQGIGDVVTARHVRSANGDARVVITKITGLSEGLPLSASRRRRC